MEDQPADASSFFKTLVSKKKRRFIADGFNLVCFISRMSLFRSEMK
jgi:hypothetical protein